MRYTQLFAKAVKTDAKGDLSINARLLQQAGFIDQLMAGSYTLLPLGFRVVKKIEKIVREEMDKTGANEVLMPLLHPKDIWNETGRWDSASEVMYKLKKEEKEYALSFTHEEIVLDLIRKHSQTYRDYPMKIYHFSTKFRDEPRAKSGILRGREFLMKDMYSVHTSQEDFEKYYWEVADAYMKVYKRIGITVFITEADGGVFTKNTTHEFQLPAAVGEDTIYFSKSWKYPKNKELMTDEDYKLPDLEEKKSIEVGNIFPFGTYYSEKMGIMFTDSDGTRKPAYFGSYGIGITRLLGAMVEVSHDEKGIIWPESIAPYQAHLVSLAKNDEVKKKANEVYKKLTDAGVEVLYDDREDVSAGQKFADADLIGIPTRLVVSEKTGDTIEVKKRNAEGTNLQSLEEVTALFS